jgi:hypothetical protein
MANSLPAIVAPPMRSSNIELLRIVAMLAIIAHHYVVNSTVVRLFDPIHPTANSVFLQLWGMWGKTAINVFVLITGYFMCERRLTLKRYLKMLFEIVFYSWAVWFVLACFGYETLTWKGVINRIFLRHIITNQNGGFVPAFMWMYLLIPAMNVYLKNVSKLNLYCTIGVLLGMFTMCGTFCGANVYHHVFWYATLYFVGAAIHKYPLFWMTSARACVCVLALSVFMAMLSVVCIDCLTAWLGGFRIDCYYFVADSHKVFSFLVSVFSFLTFKNWRLPQSQLINAIASTTFGVLLIHAATDGMRRWLWQDFIKVPTAYGFSLFTLIAYSILVMLGVFIACSAIDYLRIRFIEKPMFNFFKFVK